MESGPGRDPVQIQPRNHFTTTNIRASYLPKSVGLAFPAQGAFVLPDAVAFASHHLDPRLASRSRHCAVSGYEWGVQRLRKRQISGVISCQIVRHMPDAGEQDEMGIPRDRKVGEIGESFGAPFGGYDRRPHVAAHHLRDFQVDKMRSMQRLVGGKEEAAHTPCRRRLQEHFEKR
jgi:hypothetical protein